MIEINSVDKLELDPSQTLRLAAKEKELKFQVAVTIM